MTKYLSKKINIVSFFLILLVVLTHFYNFMSANSGNMLSNDTYFMPGVQSAGAFIEYFLSGGICLIAVPIFFLISGYLFFLTFKANIHSYLYKLKSRFFSLIIPFAIWITLGFFFIMLIQNIYPELINNVDFWPKPINILDPITKTFNSIQYQFWFLKDLIIMVIISPLLYLLIKIY